MVRSLRKSTLDQREHRGEDIKLKSKKKSKRYLKLKSRRLQKQIDRNQLDLQLDIERLAASREELSSQSSSSVSTPSRQLADISFKYVNLWKLISYDYFDTV